MFSPSTASAMITAMVSWKSWKLSSTKAGTTATAAVSRRMRPRCHAVMLRRWISSGSTGSAGMSLLALIVLHPAQDDAAEQAGGAHQQHADDDGQRHRQLQLGAHHIGAGQV